MRSEAVVLLVNRPTPSGLVFRKPARIGHHQTGHKLRCRVEVLLGEDFRRHHQGALKAALDAVEQRGERDHRLSGTNVALQEPMHWVLARKIRGYLDRGATLRIGERKRQPTDEAINE